MSEIVVVCHDEKGPLAAVLFQSKEEANHFARTARESELYNSITHNYVRDFHFDKNGIWIRENKK